MSNVKPLRSNSYENMLDQSIESPSNLLILGWDMPAKVLQGK